MNAKDVYIVAKALCQEEFIKLYAMLGEDVSHSIKSQKIKKTALITNEEVLRYLISTVFSKYKRS